MTSASENELQCWTDSLDGKARHERRSLAGGGLVLERGWDEGGWRGGSRS